LINFFQIFTQHQSSLRNILNSVLYKTYARPNDDQLEVTNLDEATKQIMQEYGLDSDTAERVKEVMDEEGLDVEAAVAFIEEGI